MNNRAARLFALSLIPALAVTCLAVMMALLSDAGTAMAQDVGAGITQPLDDGGDADTEITGFLNSRPDGGVGTWLVECEPSFTCTVIVTTTTELEDGIPPVGAWIEVRGTPQLDGTLLAQRVRAENHSSMELVIRLQAGVISSTFALANDLTPIATLVSPANIHLFATTEDEDDEIDEIRGATGVVWVEFNLINTIPDSEGFKTWHWGGEDASGYIDQAAFAQVRVGSAHNVNRGGGVTVAILDTGVALTHPAFLQSEILPGIDLVESDNLPNDTGPGFGWGHGTHVAGVVARMAPQAKILPVRVLDANGRGNSFALAYGIEWAVAQGADVINLSLGAEAGSRVLSETIASALAQGVVIVAAAGNENVNLMKYPAAFPGVLAVGAVNSASERAVFSNHGPWVDISAPGVGITSSVPFSGGAGYAAWSGTSMSTAFVSGGAALVRGAGSPGAQVAAVLMTTAAVGPNATQVGGVLDAAAAVGVKPDPVPGLDLRTYLPLVNSE
jgi:subtilisin family serine protease